MSAEQSISYGEALLPTMYGYDTADIGQWSTGNAHTMGRTRLAGEALFNVTLAMTNVVSGSAWRVEEQDGALIDAGTASGTSVNVAVPFYGSNRQAVVKVRKGTAAPFYRPYQSQAEITESGASVFISQEYDE